MNHITVKDLIAKLELCDPDAICIGVNNNSTEQGTVLVPLTNATTLNCLVKKGKFKDAFSPNWYEKEYFTPNYSENPEAVPCINFHF